MDLLWGELLGLSIFFGGIVLAKMKLLRAATALLFIAGIFNYLFYNGVFLLVLAFLFFLVGIAWKAKISRWNEE